jgi:sugar phosphate isomerase/epimerase
MYSRRDLARIALGALPAVRLLAKPNSTFRGVTIGIETYSFRDQSVEDALKAMVQAGFSSCELWEGHAAPGALTRKGWREWREAIAIEQFLVLGKTFAKAGVRIQAYNYDFAEDFSEMEIARGFQMAKALGTSLIAAVSPVTMAGRLNAYAVKAGIMVGLCNRDAAGLSSPDDFNAAMRGNANVGACLDLGDFVAAGYNPLQFINEHGDRTFALYLKDRKKNHGDSVPFGQGDTPVAAALRLVEGKRLRIPAFVVYDYRGQNAGTEAERCLAFCRQALAS